MQIFFLNLERYITDVLQILTYEWDPLHLQGDCEAKNAYENYAPLLCTLLILKKPTTLITEYLWYIETEEFDLDGDYFHSEAVARRLCAYAEMHMTICNDPAWLPMLDHSEPGTCN